MSSCWNCARWSARVRRPDHPTDLGPPCSPWAPPGRDLLSVNCRRPATPTTARAFTADEYAQTFLAMDRPVSYRTDHVDALRPAWNAETGRLEDRGLDQTPPRLLEPRLGAVMINGLVALVITAWGYYYWILSTEGGLLLVRNHGKIKLPLVACSANWRFARTYCSTWPRYRHRPGVRQRPAACGAGRAGRGAKPRSASTGRPSPGCASRSSGGAGLRSGTGKAFGTISFSMKRALAGLRS